jgi:hypothetical protein
MIVYRVAHSSLSIYTESIDHEVYQFSEILEYIANGDYKQPIDLTVQSIDNWVKNQKTSVLYYSVYDNIKFKNFISPKIARCLKDDLPIYVVYNCVKELITILDCLDIIDALTEWTPIHRPITMLVGDTIQQKFVQATIDRLAPHLSQYLNVLVFTWFVLSIGNIKNTQESTKKFSVLCRRHRPWRTYLFKQLYESKLIEQFHFSYVGALDNEKIDTIEQDLANINVKITSDFKNFLDNRPYYLGDSTVDLYSNLPSDAIQSDIHVVIEHAKFDESFAAEHPHFISEKTYKAVLAEKPFIALSSPGFLAAFRSLGYKTFSPWIHEAYDLEQDPKTRADMIVAEIARIAAMPTVHYLRVVRNCRVIARHNHRLAIKILNQNGLE